MSASVDARLLEAEKSFWEAIKNKDGRSAGRLSDDPCIIVGAQGIAELDRNTIEGMIGAAPFELKSFELDRTNINIRAIRDDVVIVAYKVHEDVRVDGSDVSLDAYDSSVWIRRNGDWVCALHTETLPGDPYGRK